MCHGADGGVGGKSAQLFGDFGFGNKTTSSPSQSTTSDPDVALPATPATPGGDNTQASGASTNLVGGAPQVAAPAQGAASPTPTPPTPAPPQPGGQRQLHPNFQNIMNMLMGHFGGGDPQSNPMAMIFSLLNRNRQQQYGGGGAAPQPGGPQVQPNLGFAPPQPQQQQSNAFQASPLGGIFKALTGGQEYSNG